MSKVLGKTETKSLKKSETKNLAVEEKKKIVVSETRGKKMKHSYKDITGRIRLKIRKFGNEFGKVR